MHQSDQPTTPDAADVAVEVAAPRSRRQLLTGLGVAAAAGVAAPMLLARPAAAAAGGNAVLGAANDAGVATTSLTSANPDGAALVVTNTSGSVAGITFDGAGIEAEGSIGVVGRSDLVDGVGLSGEALEARGVGVYGAGVRGLVGTTLGAGDTASPAAAVQLSLVPRTQVGAPTAGPNQIGDIAVDSFGRIYQCVVASPVATPTTAGTWVRPGFNPIVPFRVADTRPGFPGFLAGGKVGPGANDREVTVTGLNGVPAGATGVVVSIVGLNLTGSNGTFITIYQSEISRPPTSNLNVANNVIQPGSATLPLLASGKVKIYSDSGKLDFVMDIVGFYF